MFFGTLGLGLPDTSTQQSQLSVSSTVNSIIIPTTPIMTHQFPLLDSNLKPLEPQLSFSGVQQGLVSPAILTQHQTLLQPLLTASSSPTLQSLDLVSTASESLQPTSDTEALKIDSTVSASSLSWV